MFSCPNPSPETINSHYPNATSLKTIHGDTLAKNLSL